MHEQLSRPLERVSYAQRGRAELAEYRNGSGGGVAGGPEEGRGGARQSALERLRYDERDARRYPADATTMHTRVHADSAEVLLLHAVAAL
jgi:hypothetical protein